MNKKRGIYSIIWIGFFLVITLTGYSCTSTSGVQSSTKSSESQIGSQAEPTFSVFLIGDTGEASLNPLEPSLQTLKTHLDNSGRQSAVIFLGDNIYPSGLPAEGTSSRKRAERRLRAQLQTIEDYPGRIIFMPGNHDWHSSKRKGLQRILRQEHYIENYLQRGNTFLPDSGYPGPASVSLNAAIENPAMDFNIQLVVLDTQWWIHPHNKPLYPGISSEEHQKKKLLADVKEIISRHQDDEIIVAGHHPTFSYGRHGGKFPFMTHLLPPVLGSMYVAYRNIWGYHQDIANYGDLKNGLMESFEEKDELIYASGHEHSLQFIPHQSDSTQQYYLVSGSGTRSSYVKKQRGQSFTHRGKGFIAVRYFENQSKRIEVWSAKGNLIFQKTIKAVE
ncbi:MAG: metallophosphoesterase [Fodinibius sp.]|nr:metallophosphoesterase [Fodinibius sp.]